MNDLDRDRYRAPALDKGLDILELLAGVDGGLSQAEIAKQIEEDMRKAEVAFEAKNYDQASTIVDTRGTHPTLLRAGVVQWDRVLQFLA